MVPPRPALTPKLFRPSYPRFLRRAVLNGGYTRPTLRYFTHPSLLMAQASSQT
jgi:hypothetical protein